MIFEEFVGVRLGALARYATVVTWDPYLAEDILQDVLVRARERWSRIAAGGDAERHLQRMVVHEFLSRRRRKEAREAPVPAGTDPTGRHAERDALARAVATLPPRQRVALALHFHAELSTAEIADVLGCRAGTVRVDLDRAFATLRAALPADLVTLS